MKKTLLLSVVASTMIMAGGDIAPVEPVVEAPVVEEATGWDFNGEAVLYFQTRDNTNVTPELDLFSQEASAANVGLRLSAVNKDMFAGFGAGFELIGLGTLGLENDVVSSTLATGDGTLNSGAVNQAYLTYGIGNTSLKVGRQTLPKALSPFAFSEGWNVFKNTFGAALLVNTDLPDTTLVGAYVANANNFSNHSDFNAINKDGVYMLTAQNKSVEGLTLTGTYYYAPELFVTEDANIIWGDAAFAISDYSIALQGGTILGANDANAADEDTVAFGAKVAATFGMFDAAVAFSSVDTGTVGITNLGTGIKTPLYTQMILNQGIISKDTSYVKAGAGFSAFDGRFGVDFGMVVDSENRFIDATTGENPFEVDVTYKTKVGQNTTLFAGYVMTDEDIEGNDAQNLVRVWGRYNF